MIEYIISYAIKSVLIYLCYYYAGEKYSNSLVIIILEFIAIWWLFDNAIEPLIFNNENRNEFFSKVFSVNILNLCLSIYYILGGVIMALLYGPWKKLSSGFVKIIALFVYLIVYNRIYFSILDMANKELTEGFCACTL